MDENDSPQRPLRPETPAHPPAPNGFPIRPQPKSPLGGPTASTAPRPHGGHAPTSTRPKAPLPPAQPETSTPSRAISRGPRRKKGLFLWGLLSLAVALLALILTYVYWYQHPNKMVSDALVNTLNAKSLSFTGTVARAGSTKVDVAVDGGVSAAGGTVNAKFGFDVQGKKYTFEGSGMTNDKSDLYFKVKNIDDLVNNYRAAIPATSRPLFDQIITKVNDKWIKVSANDVKGYSENVAKAQKCTIEAVKKLQSDQATKAEIEAVYKSHPFIVIDKSLGSRGGSTGYALKTNPSETKGFTQAYKTTILYNTLKSCDSGFVVKSDDMFSGSANVAPMTFNVWIDRWTHRLTTVETTRGTTAIALHPTFNAPVTVTTPQDATTLEQLQKDVQALVQSAQK